MSEERTPYMAGVAMAPPPTPRQHEVLRFLIEYAEEHALGPTNREIADHFGWSSLSTVNEHLDGLEAAGLISRRYGVARSVVVLPAAAGYRSGSALARAIDAAIVDRILAIPATDGSPSGVRRHRLQQRMMANLLGVQLPPQEGDPS